LSAEGSPWLARGRLCLQARDFDAAESSLRRALEVQPNLSDAYELLGKLLYRDGRSDEVAALYRNWLHNDPANPVAAHLVAATGGASAPGRASDAFITSLYRRAAPQFDATAESLGYRAPQLLHENVSTVLGADWRRGRVLDLGCGTGLCGELLRVHAGSLTGVDLSDAMLGKAAERGCYDQLVRAEITEFLRSHTRDFDLVTAADVFCYFGDLAPAFAAVGSVLRMGGCFAFSVEALNGPDDTAHSLLQEHGRYAHALPYLQSALAGAGLEVESVHSESLRFERGEPVQGWILTARIICDRPLQVHVGESF
jgi:predicted TPR repeat methyltransferase